MPTLNKIGTALSRSHHTFAPDPALRALRVALTVFFAVDGFLFAGWVVRIPAIKAQVGASAGQLGLALLGVSVGAIATMMLTGRLCRAFGNERVTVATAALLAVSVALPPRTHSALALGLVLLLFGTSYGGLNVAMNSVAVDLVAALRRPVMSSFHAAYSLGGLLGAGIGGLLASHLSPATHLMLLTPIGLVTVVFAGRVLVAHPLSRGRVEVGAAGGSAAGPVAGGSAAGGAAGAAPGAEVAGRGGVGGRGRGSGRGDAAGAGAPTTGRASSGHRTALLVAVFGLIAGCSAYGEGALAEWGALHIQQDLHNGPGIAAAGYACVTSAMTLGRLTGTALLTRLGQSRALVLGGLTACVGMLVGALAPFTALVMVGFACTGLGLANLFPTAIARAGALTGPSGVAAASTLGYGGMLLGPPSIGFLTDAVGLPIALTTVSALAAVAAVIAWSVRHTSAPRAV
ncbi:putative integral membrane transport protein [Actinacidiphila reveromycinica]|uniref:Putative integral membrane transport protein n=1 Tax=Actinacidiphila reveromycinica TaxID=659352 RepID=A0A7U3VS93_9ACTN|nr:MFS transporter [Streptomyces sp. SN-593]BBB01698.1 putative integral membrane transport protein [Streptomyces sp. SN-593]